MMQKEGGALRAAGVLCEAIALGVREGAFPQAVAAPVLDRLGRAPDAQVDLGVLSSWLGVARETLDSLVQRAGASAAPTAAPLFPTGVRQVAQDLAATPRPPTEDLPTARLPRTPPAAAAPTTKRPTRVIGRPNVPRRLGPYELLDELGHGGMGIVFRARHEKLGTLCALKVLIAGEHASPEEIARFQREAASVARMGKHPNIVSVHDLATEGSLTYYVMELVEGVSLSKVLRQRDYTPPEAARLVEKVARAVHFANRHGIIHRDLKPDNVVVRTDGEPQVMDFGLARDVSSKEQLSVRGQMMGSPNYMAPEQARGDIDAIDARTDVYGLGGILYQMLTSFPPHPGRSLGDILLHVLRGEIVPPRKVRPDNPRDIDTICLKCLESDPRKRYATAEALAEDLARFQRGEPVRARPVGPMDRAWRWVKRNRRVSAILAGTAVLALIVAWRLIGPAELRVSTEPRGAQVQLIGSRFWTDRWIWPAGKVSVRVSADGYDEQTVDLRAAPGSTGNMAAVKLESNTGCLAVESDPPGAEVWLGADDTHATTPQTELRVRHGDYLLKLRLRDYDESVAQITVKASETLALKKLVLNHQKGVLGLTGCPQGMTVIVRRKGDAEHEVTRLAPPVDAPLDTGEYELEAQLQDHFTRRRDLVIPAGARAEVHVSLDRQLLWNAEVGETVLGTGTVWVADLDGDGGLDCVLATQTGSVHALSGRDGETLWVTPALAPALAASQEDMVRVVGLADADSDGSPDVIALEFSTGGHLTAFSGDDGHRLWTTKTLVSSAFLGGQDSSAGPAAWAGLASGAIGVLCLRDGTLDKTCDCGSGPASLLSVGPIEGVEGCDAVVGAGDEAHPEVCVLSGRTRQALWRVPVPSAPNAAAIGRLCKDDPVDVVLVLRGKVTALRGRDGHELWSAVPANAGYVPLSLVDIDGDGLDEVALGTGEVLSGADGTKLAGFAGGDTGAVLLDSTTFPDIDGHGASGLVSPGLAFNGHSEAYHQSGGLCGCSAKDGRFLWRYDPEFRGFNPYGRPTVADLAGDGTAQCVAANSYGTVTVLRCSDSRLLWSYDAVGGTMLLEGIFGVDNSGQWQTDLDGDGGVDWLTTSLGRLQALSGRDGQILWTSRESVTCVASGTFDLDKDGSQDILVTFADGVGVLSGRDGGVLWKASSSQGSCARAWRGDIDGDGVPDVLLWDPATSGSSTQGVLRILSGTNGREVQRLEGTDPQHTALVMDRNGAVTGIAGAIPGGHIRCLSGLDSKSLWSSAVPGISLLTATGDLDGDGVSDLIASTGEGLVAVSGKTGQVLWTSSPELKGSQLVGVGDLVGEGAPGIVVQSTTWIHALSGRNGAVLWRRALPGASSNMMNSFLTDFEGHGRMSCVVPAPEGLTVLGGRDGLPVWSVRHDFRIWGYAWFGDVDGDGVRDSVLMDYNGVCALSGRGEGLGTERQTGGVTHFSAVARLNAMRRDGNWDGLGAAARSLLSAPPDPWTGAMAHAALGVSETRARRLKEALDSFADARRLGLRAPNAAVYEWIAAHAWKECAPGRREEADRCLSEDFALHPDAAFDAFFECRAAMVLWPAEFRAVLQGLSLNSIDRPVAAVLLAHALPDGKRPCLPEGGARDLILAAREDLGAKLRDSTGSPGREFGYLALMADALGDEEGFARARTAYREQPHRPLSLDTLIEEASVRPRADQVAYASGQEAERAKDWMKALTFYQTAFQMKPTKEEYRFAYAQACHFVGWLLATGKPPFKDWPVAPPKPDPRRAVTLVEAGLVEIRGLLASMSARPGTTPSNYHEEMICLLDTLGVAYAARNEPGDIDKAIAAVEEALRDEPSAENRPIIEQRLKELRARKR